MNSLPLSGLSISVTGVSSKEEVKAERIIKQLGGTFASDLVRSVHCVLVRKVGTKKHETAQKWKIPTVEFRWLDDCKKENKFLPFKEYEVRAFVGCVVTCTHVSASERTRIKRMVEENGGEYHPSLERNKTTHLIAVHTAGEKYLHAQSWGNVKIVNASWVENCSTLGSWVPETQYAVYPNNHNADEGKESRRGFTDLICDASVQANNDSCEKGTNLIEQIHGINSNVRVQEVIDGDKMKKKRTSKSEIGNVFQLSDLPPLNLFAPLEKCETFRRDTFFVHGFRPEVRDYIVQLIIRGGGKRHHMLTTGVTKILLGEFSDLSLQNEIKRHPNGAKCVRLSWVLDSLMSDSTFSSKRDAKFIPVADGQSAIDHSNSTEGKENLTSLPSEKRRKLDLTSLSLSSRSRSVICGEYFQKPSSHFSPNIERLKSHDRNMSKASNSSVELAIESSLNIDLESQFVTHL